MRPPFSASNVMHEPRLVSAAKVDTKSHCTGPSASGRTQSGRPLWIMSMLESVMPPPERMNTPAIDWSGSRLSPPPSLSPMMVS